jgi:hypothetical protein
MSQDEVEQVLPGWQGTSQAVAQELAEWRKAHPKATLTEIEEAVFEAMQKLQARAMGDVVQASSTADLAAGVRVAPVGHRTSGSVVAHRLAALLSTPHSKPPATRSGSTETANMLLVEARLSGSKVAACTGLAHTSTHWSRCERWRVPIGGTKFGRVSPLDSELRLSSGVGRAGERGIRNQRLHQSQPHHQ